VNEETMWVEVVVVAFSGEFSAFLPSYRGIMDFFYVPDWIIWGIYEL